MKGNDISNRYAPYIGFDIDSLLFDDLEEGVISRILRNFKIEPDVYENKRINYQTLHVIEHVWQKHDVSVCLATFKKGHIKRNLEKFLQVNDVPYTRLQFLDLESVREFPYTYFFSNNEELLSYISKESAMKLSEIWRVL